jgi:predicted secreted acid phosphatase
VFYLKKFKLGQWVKFDKHIKKDSFGKSREVTKELAEICGLKFNEDNSHFGGYRIPKCPWKGFKLTSQRQGIVCGVRNIGVSVFNNSSYGDWELGIEKHKQVYLVADKLSGFYYVLPEWLE